jgi:hypothetical protein
MKKIQQTAKKVTTSARFVSGETPWGPAQTAEEIAPGIILYSTASHGGYFLSKAANAKVPAILKNSTFGGQGLKGWYEEDCDWAIVGYIFKELFDEAHYRCALETLEQHHSDAWKKLQKKAK